MSLVPNQLNLTDEQSEETLNINFQSSGIANIVASNSLITSANHTVRTDCFDFYIKPAGNILVLNSDETKTYSLPSAQTAPEEGQTMIFSSDGSSVFGTIGAGGNFSTPSNQNLDMNSHLINNITSLNLTKSGGYTMDINPFNPDAGAATLQTTTDFAVVSSNSMALVANGGPLQLSSSVALRVIVGGTQLYNFPISQPTINQVMVSAFNPNPSGATDLVFVDLPPNLSSQVATLEQKVADLSTVIYNLTNITIP
jgi:hypothetical protein